MVILSSAEEDAILPLLAIYVPKLPEGPARDHAMSALEKVRSEAVARLGMLKALREMPPVKS